MGYTNYWTYKKPFDDNEWSKIKDEYDYIVENFDGEIIKNETPVHKFNEYIRFNGIGENEHETFLLYKDFRQREKYYKDMDIAFDFCKTNRKPYDLAVWHMLSFAKNVNDDKIEIRRDR